LVRFFGEGSPINQSGTKRKIRRYAKKDARLYHLRWLYTKLKGRNESVKKAFTTALAIKEAEWKKPFLNRLDKSDRKRFNEMFDICTFYLSVCSYILL
jgi:hypothetical protein